MTHDGHARSLKEKALEELREFWIISIYLIVFLGCFNLYRRLVLTDAGVPVFSYGFRLIEALIVAKIILIGEAFGLGRQYENRPLVIAVLRKALLFGVFIAAFNLLERGVEGYFHAGHDWAGALEAIRSVGIYEMLARTLVMMIALIPFFGFVELGRVLGPGKLSALFFGRPEPRG